MIKFSLILILAILSLPISAFANCYKYMAGSVGGKYEIVVRSHYEYDSIEYIYESQLENQDYIGFVEEHGQLRELVNGKKVRNYLDSELATDDFFIGTWTDKKNNRSFSFEYGLDTTRYIKVNEYENDNHNIYIYRRQLGQGLSVLAVKIDDSDIIPFVLSDCGMPFEDWVHASLISPELGIWKISAESEGQGSGNYFWSVSAVISIEKEAKILAWNSWESSGSINYRQDITTDYRIENQSLLLVKETETYESSENSTNDSVKGTYTFMLNNLSEVVDANERHIRYVNQELVLDETNNIDLDSNLPILLNKEGEGYAGFLLNRK